MQSLKGIAAQVAAAAEEQAANDVRAASGVLSRQAEGLCSQVESFLAGSRAA